MTTTKTTTTVAVKSVWGTWEELILGGAVLRHGPQSWDLVSSELRSRTVSPFNFTPEACKAKYDDLQKQYDGCTTLLEELRKRRVTQLKQELEESEGSICSLELKLQCLKSEKGDSNHSQVHYSSCETNSLVVVPLLKSEHIESSVKEASNEVLSTSSFSRDIKKDLEFTEQNKSLKTLQKRRGKRKRREICDDNARDSVVNSKIPNGKEMPVKSNSINDSENLASTTASSMTSGRNKVESKHDDLLATFDSIALNKHGKVFQHRLDTQKTSRYRRTIRQHMDFDTIKARLAGSSILSMEKLFRDMLLVANNAIAYYSRKMPEYNSAVLLREMITEAYEQHLINNSTSNNISSSSMELFPSSIYNPPVRPRSSRPRNPRVLNQAPNFNSFFGITARRDEKTSNNNVDIVDKTDERRERLKIAGRSAQSCKKVGKSTSSLSQNCRKVNQSGSTKKLGETLKKMVRKK
ncbi:uncharacterized protein LOC124911997 [Impatiens glandulifera]|uniref:uncharacterized protein LOC124911997 n=1 Tax=Impatiens glandulifera TaxID=253017 RepID=UPI001FB1592A|nr:uncharacterized protein LOC124911997 [Impatiens glandulifera]